MIVNSIYNDIAVLRAFDPISLADMDEVRLMNRTDTKFVFKRSDLEGFLEKLKPNYNVLNINDHLISTYKTLYYDTEGFQFFKDHHNGRGNRHKVRIRNYVESGLFFLEVKNKFKDRTIKHRISVDDFQLNLDSKSTAYINEVIEQPIVLESKLWNNFKRITLVSKNDNERLTLDLGLSFDWESRGISYDGVVVAELKQDYANRESAFYSLMKANLIRTNGMSKYCVGSVGIYPDLKYNNFKEKILSIEKLI